MFFSRRMPFPGGRIIGFGEGNNTREGNQHPHMDDSGEWHWIPIFVGVLFLIIMIIVIIYKCLVSNLIFCIGIIERNYNFKKIQRCVCL